MRSVVFCTDCNGPTDSLFFSTGFFRLYNLYKAMFGSKGTGCVWLLGNQVAQQGVGSNFWVNPVAWFAE